MRVLYAKSLYSKEALLKAAYHFTDNYYVYLGVQDDAFFVDFTSKNEQPIDEEKLQNEFKNEILAQVIHQTVATETSELRKILVARALSSTMVEENESIAKKTEPVGLDKDAYDELSAIARDWYDGK